MTYLLDTNICIELLNKHDARAARKLASINPREIRLCSVVKAELYHGAYKSGREKNIALVRTFSPLLNPCHSMISLPNRMDDCALRSKSRENSLVPMTCS